MGLADPTDSLRVPGRLCIAPTDLGTAFPHGGTSLGDVIGFPVYRHRTQEQEIVDEGFDGEIVEVVVAAANPILAAVTRGFDDDMVSTVFNETATGGSSGDTIIRETSTNRAYLGSTKAVKLLFSPRSTLLHPAVIFYNALPMVDIAAEMALNIGEDIGMAVVFRAIRDSNGKRIEIAKLEDMSLT